MFQEKIITWETTLDNYYPEMIQIKIITEHSFNNILILSVYINFFLYSFYTLTMNCNISSKLRYIDIMM